MIHDENRQEGIVLSPKMSFILGLVGGVLVICTIGFFILLGIVLNGDGKGKSVAAEKKVIPTAAAPSADYDEPVEQVGEVAPVTDADYVMGDEDAPVTIITYTDFQCPFCNRFHSTMLQVLPSYEGKVRWVYRNFPLSFHPNAIPAANAVLCAGEQGKYWEFVESLFAKNDVINGAGIVADSVYTDIATSVKLNKSKFTSCYTAKKYQSRITDEQTSGSAAGVTGTPGSIIIAADGSIELMSGALPAADVSAKINAALAR